MSKIITANLLATGTVVFLGRDGTWDATVETARLFPDQKSAEDVLAVGTPDASPALVVDAFVTDRDPDHATEGMTLRDRIRAHGPTIAFLPHPPRGAGGGVAKAATRA